LTARDGGPRVDSLNNADRPFRDTTQSPPMNLSVGQILRLSGLLIEAFSVVQMLSVRRGNFEFWERHGVNPGVALPLLFVFGLILWVSGTLRMRKDRLRMKG
jgi:hypothetical protein